MLGDLARIEVADVSGVNCITRLTGWPSRRSRPSVLSTNTYMSDVAADNAADGAAVLHSAVAVGAVAGEEPTISAFFLEEVPDSDPNAMRQHLRSDKTSLLVVPAPEKALQINLKYRLRGLDREELGAELVVDELYVAKASEISGPG